MKDRSRTASRRRTVPRTPGTERLKGMSPSEKRQTVTASFERKVMIMEAMTKRPANEGDWWPSTLLELREWSDPERGLIVWTDAHVDSPTGPNHELRQRFDKARKDLNNRSPVKALKSRQHENQILKAERDALAVQNLMLIAEIQSLRDELSRTRTTTHQAPIRLRPAK
jgi:hypothetical protein